MSVSGSVSGGIAALKDLHLRTVLVENGRAGAAIVAPAGEGYASSVGLLLDRVSAWTGVALPVLSPDDLPPETIRRYNLILLGNAPDNALVRRLLWERWLLDTWYPGDGTFVVRSIHNPFGLGTNVLFLGGENPESVRAAAAKFLDTLKPGPPLAAGWTMAFETDRRGQPVSEEAIRGAIERADTAMKFQNGRSLISGAAGMAHRYYDTGQEGWAELFKIHIQKHMDMGALGTDMHMAL
jgi:hypothetical protein